MPCIDPENTPLPGDTENVLLRKLLNRLCNISSGGGGGGVSQAYVDARDAATLVSANAFSTAGDAATLAAALASASSLYVLKSGDTMTGALLLPTGAVGAPSLSHAADANTGLWFPAADTIAVSTAGAERLRILSTGEVGIGTALPTTTLDVAGNINLQGAAQSYRIAGNRMVYRDGTSVYLGDIDGSSPLPLTLRAAGNDWLFISTTGKVGIGVAPPLAKLHVTPSASGTDYFRIDHSDGTPRFQMGVSPGGAGYAALWMGSIVPSASNYTLVSEGTISILNAVSQLYLGTGGSNQWSVLSAGHLVANTDNTYDIGASGATRPKSVYIANLLVTPIASVGTLSTAAGDEQQITGSGSAGGSTALLFKSWNGASFNDFTRLQFGGTTSAFPSIKRSSATLQARLADDSAFADISVASIRTNNAAALVISSVAMNDGAAAALGTLTDAPVAGNPTKWVPIDDNGTTRYVPAW